MDELLRACSVGRHKSTRVDEGREGSNKNARHEPHEWRGARRGVLSYPGSEQRLLVLIGGREKEGEDNKWDEKKGNIVLNWEYAGKEDWLDEIGDTRRIVSTFSFWIKKGSRCHVRMLHVYNLLRYFMIRYLFDIELMHPWQVVAQACAGSGWTALLVLGQCRRWVMLKIAGCGQERQKSERCVRAQPSSTNSHLRGRRYVLRVVLWTNTNVSWCLRVEA